MTEEQMYVIWSEYYEYWKGEGMQPLEYVEFWKFPRA